MQYLVQSHDPATCSGEPDVLEQVNKFPIVVYLFSQWFCVLFTALAQKQYWFCFWSKTALISYNTGIFQLSNYACSLYSTFGFRDMERSLQVLCITWPINGEKSIKVLEIPDQNASIHSLCHFQGATTKIKPCYRLNSLQRMRIITWHLHRVSSKTTRYNFLTPNCSLAMTLL